MQKQVLIKAVKHLPINSSDNSMKAHGKHATELRFISSNIFMFIP